MLLLNVYRVSSPPTQKKKQNKKPKTKQKTKQTKSKKKTKTKQKNPNKCIHTSTAKSLTDVAFFSDLTHWN